MITSAAINTRPGVGVLRRLPRPIEPEAVPVGSLVCTPTGQLARVIGHRGLKRDFRVRLVCKYVKPVNRRYDVVLLVPELVTVVAATPIAQAHAAEEVPA